mmetsp:Transcript_24465/g.36281  ORF Transcript_24465/g.36281 Transcript_24465/m.36281 type:complete len:188 (-) Transcript_24465:286-849(-)|eukprot:CAMPEP_0194077806 /NCGR_PEP_ID=MMETSP0149-20130528/4373_1 /TAXON_ID=122233 /ORGANISM="Chaetoceros debilis, Strain MM31A-1" /LENGTH=187 /DNA_ID=CAMNT_0038758949 /DNA_START=90 /DNA_END=653 /DNA_ORIENTATION=+
MNPQPSSARKDNQSKLPQSGVPYGHLPAFLPGSASLVEQIDRRIMIVLRDGRHLVGILRSFDQFSNMVLGETSERRVLHLQKDKETICYFTDIKLGLYLVRGDSMVLLGEVENKDEDAEDTRGQSEGNSGEGMSGSGLLNGTERNANEESKKHMKEVTLAEFEELKKKLEGNSVDELTWEFDLDLVV